MAFAPSASWNSPSITHLASCLSPSLPMNFSDEPENQLGYKMVKWIERIEFVESEKQLGKGEGGTNEDDEYFDLLPNI
jgi:hypothetical protein